MALTFLAADLNLEWGFYYGGGNNDSAEEMLLTSDGGYITAGYTESYGTGIWGKPDMWLVKFDAIGQIEWEQTYGQPDSLDKAYDIIDAGDGYVLVGERFYDIVAGAGMGGIVMKTDYQGNEIWSRKHRGDDKDMLRHIEVAPSGGFISCGVTRSNGAQFIDGWIVKLDDNGFIEWETFFGGTGYEVFKSIYPTSDGGYIAGGYTNTGITGSYDIWFVKVDSQGNFVWENRIGDAGNNRMYDFIPTSDGNYVVTGEWENASGAYEMFLIKVDPSINILWQQSYQQNMEGCGNQVKETFDGGYIIAGDDYNAIGGPGQTDGWIVKTDPQGLLEEEFFVHHSASDHFQAICEVSPGTYFAAGGNMSNGGGMTDLWTIKLVSDSVPIGYLEGTVTNSENGAVMQGVSVIVNGIETLTNTSGFYQFPLAVGNHQVEYSFDGFVTQQHDTVIVENQYTVLDVVLEPIVYTYPAPQSLELEHLYDGETTGNTYILSWSAPETVDVPTLSTYRVYVDAVEVAEIPITQLEYTCYPVNMPSNGNEYYFYVIAYYTNPDGESVPSNEQTAPFFVNVSNNTQAFVTNLITNYPNPFNPTTKIRFSLAEKKIVRLSIYNARGQRVKSYPVSQMPKGTNSVTWNGDDDSGKSVSSGVYWFKLTVEGKSETHKMVLMK